MKRIFIAASLLMTILQVRAQDKAIVSREFWQQSPDLETVKAELAKGFSFSEAHGMADPVVMAINNNASAATIQFLLDQPGVEVNHVTHEGRIYLHWATNKGNAEVVDYLIKKGTDIYFPDANNHTALTFAAGSGTLTPAVIDAFLKGGLDIKRKYKDGANLLLLAVPADKDMVITNYLVSKGFSLNSTDDEGNTAFNYAARMGNVTLMKTLLEKGVKYNANALIMASQGTFRSANTIDVYRYLVDDLKVDPKTTSKAGQNVLHGIVRKQNQAEMVKYFLEKGVDMNKADNEGNTPFISAAGGKSTEVVELMLPKVKNINAVNGKGESALMVAVKGSSAEVVNLLLKSGADVKIADKDGNNLAYYLADGYRGAGGRGGRGGFGGGMPGAGGAGRGGANGGAGGGAPQAAPQDVFADKLNALKAAGLDITAPQKNGNTLYHLAVMKNDIDLLKKLEGLQIDVNAKNKEGLTALHKAAMVCKDDAILKYLLSVGAQKELATAYHESVYDLAKENESLTKSNVSLDFLK